MIADKIILEAIKDLPIERQQHFIALFDEQSIQDKVVEAKRYLEATDFKMTVDYDEDVVDVKLKRKEAREFIRENEIKE
jgi:hypothetical protein